MTRELSVDDEMDAYWDVQVVAAMKERQHEEKTHRCPPDMPPCPDCEAIYEAEDERDYFPS